MPDNLYYSIIMVTPVRREYFDYIEDEERGIPYVLNEFCKKWNDASPDVKSGIIEKYGCVYEGEPIMQIEEYNHTMGTTETIFTLKDMLEKGYGTSRRKELEEELKRMYGEEMK